VNVLLYVLHVWVERCAHWEWPPKERCITCSAEHHELLCMCQLVKTCSRRSCCVLTSMARAGQFKVPALLQRHRSLALYVRLLTPRPMLCLPAAHATVFCCAAVQHHAMMARVCPAACCMSQQPQRATMHTKTETQHTARENCS